MGSSFKTLEHENQGLLDNGAIGANTKLYYRELIARFGHHLALNWNLCEEIGDWADHGTPSMPLDINQRRALSEYIYESDALEGDTYIVLLKNGGESTLDLQNNSGRFSVLWYDTRNGGELQTGEVKTIQGGGKKSLGLPPTNVNRDWVVLVIKI